MGRPRRIIAAALEEPKKVVIDEDEELDADLPQIEGSEEAEEVDEDSEEDEEAVEAEPETEVQAMRRELAELRKQVVGEESVMVQKVKRIPEVFIRFFEEDDQQYPIVFFKDSREKGDRLFANFLILKDGKEELRSYDQIKLLNEMPRYHGQIVKEKWARIPKHQGSHPRKITPVDPNPWNDGKPRPWNPSQITLEHMEATCMVSVLLTEGPMKGQKIKIHSVGNALNA